jgi:hypothetical protein
MVDRNRQRGRYADGDTALLRRHFSTAKRVVDPGGDVLVAIEAIALT